MTCVPNDQLPQMETTCGSLLYELQIIWDEVGESEMERDKMLLELEQECLEVYRRKVDHASRSRAQLRRAIADSEAELAAICSAMGERPVYLRQSNQKPGSLKEELNELLPQLEEIRKRKSERWTQFLEVLEQIQKMSNEIRPEEYNSSKMMIDESDLSIKRLEELHRQLQALQKEKTDRLKQVLDLLNSLNSLCFVLGMDFKHTISEIHPSLDESCGLKSISNDTIKRLTSAIQGLRETKLQRMQKLQDLATSMLELWNLMDTPIEEQQMFQNVTCNIAASEHEITEPGTLSLDFISYVEAEVSRLEELKASKMKDLVLKKKAELEELRRRAHLLTEASSEIEFAVETIETGAVDPSLLLEQLEIQISNVKEEAFSRKEILEKVEKWMAACEEECWLEEYNRDENRYNAGRGAHLTLKRAEKARATVNKIPATVEALFAKSTAWEREKGIQFTYDGVPLLSMLDEYTVLRQEKEQERRRQRDQKRLQGQLIAEQESLFGSKPSPSKNQSAKKVPRTSTGGPGSRRLSLGGGAMLTQPKHDLFHTKSTRSTRKPDESTMLSAGRRGLDVAGLPAKKLSFVASNAREAEAAPPRKPFCPVDAAAAAPPEMNTPLRPVITPVDEENRTPQAVQQIPAPKTPKTVPVSTQMAVTPASAVPTLSTPMTPISTPLPLQMAMTPAAAPFALEQAAACAVQEEIDYSFEESRAGFALPTEQVKTIYTHG
uniref:65-kDa microtubule-associated protein 3 n=1 Tax=Anthurium amnicola TaxID=1678845 RepID=A0A1D1XLT1_9ARAE